MTFRIHPLGDRALLCEASAPASVEHQRRIWALADAAQHWPHVTEVVPGVNNLLVVFAPLAADVPALTGLIERGWKEHADAPARVGRQVDIPVAYGGADGPDLADVARHAGLSPKDVVELHSAAQYTVFCMGFQPGFAYLGGLDPRLATPRRSTPRMAVPAGSVAIGGAQTAVYPARSPGGWNLIGRTDMILFDPQATPPTPLAAGDLVRFVPSRGDA